jgi:processive 1,2-diacylglycerol beta-glucosyltransferase
MNQTMRSPERVLILSAMVGYGHHAAALALEQELRTAAPDLAISVRDGLGDGRGSRLFLEHVLRRQLISFPRSYSWTYGLLRMAPTRGLAVRMCDLASSRQLTALIAAERPSVIVSTYPAVTAALGVMRRRGAVAAPVCSLITDVAGLHFWAHPGVDLHLACYRESLPEISMISSGAPARLVSPPVAAAHRHGRDRRSCLASLGLAPELALVVVSGGGWGVGDLDGAVAAALSCERVQLVVACGKNDRLEARLRSRYAHERRVRVLGFTDAMPRLLGGASALVHSTGGVTCLEAAVHNCPVIAYGFGHGHLRENLRAMSAGGLLRHARSREELARELREVLACDPQPSVAEPLPSASSQILALLAERAGMQSAANAPAADRLPRSLAHAELEPA